VILSVVEHASRGCLRVPFLQFAEAQLSFASLASFFIGFILIQDPNPELFHSR